MTTPVKIDAKAIIAKFEVEDDRTKISLYLSKGLYKAFQKKCGKAPASRVMEELMKAFLES